MRYPDRVQVSQLGEAGDRGFLRKLIVNLAALALLALGLAVCVGWIIGDATLIQLRPGWVPMKFNAALGLAVFGVGAALLVHGARRAARACALFVFAIGGATAAQYLLQINLHIDQLFVRAFMVEPGSTPGRMSPVTASLLAACAAGLFIVSFRESRARSTLVGIVASIVSGVSVTALIGYATQTPVAYLWGALAGVAIHAAGSFVIAAAALGALATRPEEKLLPHWAPWAALIWGLACTGSLGGALIQQFAATPESMTPEVTIIIGSVLSVLMAWALHSRRELAGALAASARSEEMVRGILEAAPDAMLIVDAKGCIVLANDMTEKQFGYTRAELLGETVDLLTPIEVRHTHAMLREKFAAAPSSRFMGDGRELMAQRRDGTKVPVEIALSPVKLRGNSFTVAAVRDITLRRETEQRLRESLQEKEILLKEIHHRVKNNLQVVASMLALQADKAVAEAQSPLEDCRQRVMSMALVHEKLYGAKDLQRIDLGDLTREIATMLISECVGPAIRTQFTVEPIAIDIERAVPASLIINELMTNSLKHAFKGRAAGLLSVSVRRCEDDHVWIEVADDGVGGVQADSIRTGRTLGMTIVRNLVKQLDARLSIGSGPGTAISITFPIGRGQDQ
ncbi:sensor histidine kinase [Steroidobacter flavus]|uniref:histidine kinase n=1 Tax=Steroidobacter flavus TaxID=1842136 RepID=A0ABV8T454_9GAMM